mmetsp:Transcript_3772/g.7732  ORF Transcript_3772/g.7732 Transcript_3772/m.7732 type:complete len:643 (+) Transcript_3772:60-1988(+)
MARKGRRDRDDSSSSEESDGSSSGESGRGSESSSSSSRSNRPHDDDVQQSTWEKDNEDLEQGTNSSEPFDEEKIDEEDPEQPKTVIDWDNLTAEQQMVYNKYMVDPNRRIRAMAEQKFHLPGNNWKEDWRQYFANNHPLFGICFHDPDHPIGLLMRAMCFLSSTVFGLCMTNFFWLWARTTDKNESLFTVELGTRPGSNLTGYVVDVDESNAVQVTPDIIMLWTIGAMIHGAFDNLIWTLSICACCDPGGRFEHLHRYKRFGVGLLVFFVILIMALTTLTVVVRGVIENSEEEPDIAELQSGGVFDDNLDLSTSTKENYEFMMSFTVEMALALLVYFPLLGTIFFWGVLGCFKYPLMGGRPYEMMEERETLQELMQNPDEYLVDRSQTEWEDEPMFGMRLKDDDGNAKPSPFWDLFKKKHDSDLNSIPSREPRKKFGFFGRQSKNVPQDGSESLDDEPSSDRRFWGGNKAKGGPVNQYDNAYPSATTTRYDPKTGEELPPKEEAKSNSWFGGRSSSKAKKKNDSAQADINAYPSPNVSSVRYDPTTGDEYTKEDSQIQKSVERKKKKTAYPKADKSTSRYDPTGASDGSAAKKKQKKSSKSAKSSGSDYPSVNKRASRLDVNSTSDKPPKKKKKKSKKKASK